VLAQDVVASMPLPPFDNSAMDGYAIRHCDLIGGGETALRLIGEQFAGRSVGLPVGEGECIRITTGAPLPPGADTVVIKEDARVEGDHIFVPSSVRFAAHVRRVGEDVQPGDDVLQRGQMLTPARVSLAASLGIDQLEVARRPTVAVFTTGDELIEPGIPLQPGEIYNSNRELLMGLLRADGLEPTAWPTLPDEPARLASMLRDAASSFNVVITCGAVSAGEKDHIPALLQQHGQVHFWKVRMKPGMPLLFGQLERAQFLGLPGNPVSVLATYLTLGRTLLDGLQGRAEPRPAWHARLSMAFDKRHARREFLRGRLLPGMDGMLQVSPNPADGSHRLAAAAQSDALIVLPEGERAFAVADVVEVLPY
ncbi:MAG TPA: gephyrin-like molybdotransferase Glp, partial [Luteimonas sp.]|nr:gephyrin-like molybdotransferase Glp [Luteimonas sp.]